MASWLKRIRGALGTGLTWAVAWALAGLAIGVTSIAVPVLPWHYFFDVFDAPLPALAVPGFLAGTLFSLVLGIAARRRGFSELSPRQFAAWGALGGLALSLPFGILGALNLANRNRPDISSLQIIVVACGSVTLLSAASAAATLMLARRSATPPPPALPFPELQAPAPTAVRSAASQSRRSHP
jgi:hypothetical protein